MLIKFKASLIKSKIVKLMLEKSITYKWCAGLNQRFLNTFVVICTLFFMHPDAYSDEKDILKKCTKSGCYTKTEAIEKAKAAVQEEGNVLSNYELPIIQLKKNIWTIRFVGREKIPGNYCVVFIDNKVGSVTFMHGE